MKRLLTLPLAVLCVFLYVRCSEGASPAQGHVKLGIIYYQAGEYDEAIAQLQKAIALDPNLVSAHNGLGATYFNQGKYDLAAKYCQKAITITPKAAGLHYKLACIYSLQDKKALSIESLRKAIGLDKDFIGVAENESDFDNIRESPGFQAFIHATHYNLT